MSEAAAITALAAAREELAEIHRGKHYALWRADTKRTLGESLLQTSPFQELATHLIATPSGATRVEPETVGAWAIDQLVSRRTPEAMLAHVALEIRRNASRYTDVRSICGVIIDAPCRLAPGVEVAASPNHLSILPGRPEIETVAELRQVFSVAPALVASRPSAQALEKACAPDAPARDDVSELVWSACLLLGEGATALGDPEMIPEQADLLREHREAHAVVVHQAAPCDSRIAASDLERTFAQLKDFAAPEPLRRAIRRLGRARAASDPVERALELGICAEIALTHADKSSGEIAFRLATRMAWLLGGTPDERGQIFRETKALYDARSKAVHEGRLSRRVQPDLVPGDRLVTQALRMILANGAFPDWSRLTMGGGWEPP